MHFSYLRTVYLSYLYRICWQYDADQTTNVANISWKHGVGYELFEVRTGNGLLPIKRLRDKKPIGTVDAIQKEFHMVLKLAFGYDGDLKRTKAHWFAEQFARSWEEGGSALSEVKRVFESVA
jgi:hypothetical protein